MVFSMSFFFFSYSALSQGKLSLTSQTSPVQGRCCEDYSLTGQWLFQPVSIVSMPREEEVCMWP